MTTAATATGRSAGERARWARLASFSLVLAAVGPLTMLAGGLAWGLDIGDELPIFVTAIALAVLGAYLFQRAATPARVGGVLLALVLGGMLFWTAFSLPAINSFFDFLPALVVLPGSLLAIGAGVSAIRAQRRGDLVAADAPERKVIAGLLIAVVGLGAVSALLTLTSRSSVDDPSAASVSVVATDFEFDRASYTVSAGDDVLVTNDDPFLHTFTVDELGIDVALTPGSEKLVTIPEDASGTYVVYCVPHTRDREDPSEDDMVAELEVR